MRLSMQESRLFYAAGFLLIALGSGVGLAQSYAGNTVLVAVSLVSFIAGYRICQYSLSEKETFELLVLSSESRDISSRKEFAYLLTGVAMISQGFIFLASSIQGKGIECALIGGVLIILGYVPTHLSVNETVI